MAKNKQTLYTSPLTFWRRCKLNRLQSCTHCTLPRLFHLRFAKKSMAVCIAALAVISKTIRFLILLPIYGYQYMIRPFIPMACRFEPTCSAYAIEAIQTLGILKGMGKAAFRLLRCHPWCVGGHDPVVPNARYKI